MVVVGGANLDVLARSRDPVRFGTSNPGTTTATPGGVGRNVAETLGRLGTSTTLVTAIGDDPAGDLVLTATTSAGVTVTPGERVGATDRYTAVLDHDGALVAGVADMRAVATVAADDLADEVLIEASWLVLDGNLRAEVVEQLLRRAAERSVPVVLDPVSAPKAALLRDSLCAGPLHTITPTLDELEALTGEADIGAATRTLHDLGVHTIWLRSGAEGSTLHRADAPPCEIRLGPVEAVDVTGAGDAMLAAYVHFLVQGCPVTDAAHLGAAAALLAVQSPLTVRPDLTADLVRATLEEHR